MKIDLHVHSSERSSCGRATEEAQIRAAIAAGLDALAFTDHHRLVPSARLDALNRQYAPFRIFSGIEVSSSGEDFIVLGIQDAALESSAWQYPDLYAFVRARGGFIALAHPFRFHDHLPPAVERFRPNAVELYSSNTPPEADARIRALASRWRVPMLCNSDAHTTEPIGKYYNVLEHYTDDAAELVAMLNAGTVRWRKTLREE